MTIADKAVLVTGANRGIGQALVEEALKRGAKRVYAGTRQPLFHSDGRVTPLILDVTNAQQIQEAVALCGIQPSGEIHIGNYLGAIRNWVEDQGTHDAFYCVVDLHALTLDIDPAELRARTHATALDGQTPDMPCSSPLPQREAGARQSLRYIGELLSDRWSVLIFPEGERAFFSKLVDAQITFNAEMNGKAGGLVLHQGGRDLPGQQPASRAKTALIDEARELRHRAGRLEAGRGGAGPAGGDARCARGWGRGPQPRRVTCERQGAECRPPACRPDSDDREQRGAGDERPDGGGGKRSVGAQDHAADAAPVALRRQG